MSKKSVKVMYMDRVFLLISAIIVSGVVFTLPFFLEDYLSLSRGWEFFIDGSILYTILTLYYAKKRAFFPKYSSRLIPFVVLMSIIGGTIFLAFSIFHLNFVPLPSNFWFYTFGCIVLAPLSLKCSEYWLKIMKRGKH